MFTRSTSGAALEACGRLPTHPVIAIAAVAMATCCRASATKRASFLPTVCRETPSARATSRGSRPSTITPWATARVAASKRGSASASAARSG